jgi:class 3 adenylate cyclase
VQQRFERRNRAAEEQLLIKVGVSLGDATSSDGDYFGMPVIEASRTVRFSSRRAPPPCALAREPN